ncbi:hypothetical protein ACFSC4_02385 [Deinococcus malanensis]|uniref:hypothetical protein n=1 Tax=Deinococcus malanensis TaxID=1706855 RepID=UPI00363A49B8
MRTYAATAQFPDLLCFHGSPARDNEELVASTAASHWATLRDSYGVQSAWAGGHTHKPLHLPYEGWSYFNPGSVGLPYERPRERMVNVARAEYLILDHAGASWTPIFRAVLYSVEDVIRGILASDMPHARWLAGEWVGAV